MKILLPIAGSLALAAAALTTPLVPQAACNGNWAVDVLSSPYVVPGVTASNCAGAAAQAGADLENRLIAAKDCPGCDQGTGCEGEANFDAGGFTCTDNGDGTWDVSFTGAITKVRCTVCST